jgi:hypothetical protein
LINAGTSLWQTWLSGSALAKDRIFPDNRLTCSRKEQTSSDLIHDWKERTHHQENTFGNLNHQASFLSERIHGAKERSQLWQPARRVPSAKSLPAGSLEFLPSGRELAYPQETMLRWY